MSAPATETAALQVFGDAAGDLIGVLLRQLLAADSETFTVIDAEYRAGRGCFALTTVHQAGRAVTKLLYTGPDRVPHTLWQSNTSAPALN